MIRDLPILSLVFAVLATSAQAQEVLVRTAEHDEFTRIVVDFSDRPNWTLSNADDTFMLQTDQSQLRYDLSNVYQRITEERISRITTRDGALEISLNCNCDIDTTELPNEGLILDIFNVEPDELPSPEIPTQDDPPRLARLPSWYAQPHPLLPGPLVEAATTAVTPQQGLLDRAETRRELIEELARGSSQGLVDTAGTLDRFGDSEKQQAVPPRPEVDAEISSLTEQLAQFGNMRVDTQKDRDRIKRSAQLDPPSCGTDLDVDIGSWGSPDKILGQIGILNATVTDDTGRIDRTVAERAAKELLYAGFGAEARATLDLAEGESDVSPALRALTRLVDFDGPTGAFAGFAHCPGPVALWAALDTPNDEVLAQLNISSLRREFSQLPPHLRTHFGPFLVGKFLEIGDRDTALFLREAILRGGTDTDVEMGFVDAKLSLDANNIVEADEQLTEMAAKQHPDAAEALVLLIDTRLETGQGISQKILDQADALAFELENDSAKSLKQRIVNVLTRDGRFDEAFERVERERAFEPVTRVDLQEQIHRQINKISSNAEFLRQAMAAIKLGRHSEEGITSLERATRLLDLGVPEMARAALNIGNRVPDRAERVFLARSFLTDGKAEIALSYLTGLQGEDIEALRTEATSSRGQNSTLIADDPGEITPQAVGVMVRNRQILDDVRSARAEIDRLLED